MPPRCAACAHPDRLAIDAALVNGASVRTVAASFSLDRNAVHRHARNHLSADLAAGAMAHAVATVAPTPAVSDGPSRALDFGVPQTAATPPAPSAPATTTATPLPPIGAASGPLDPYAIACELRDRALGILRAAEHRGDARTALEAVRASVPLLDRLDRLMPRASASADAAPAALASSPEWATVRAVLMGALAPFPEARAAVAAALAGGT